MREYAFARLSACFASPSFAASKSSRQKPSGEMSQAMPSSRTNASFTHLHILPRYTPVSPQREHSARGRKSASENPFAFRASRYSACAVSAFSLPLAVGCNIEAWSARTYLFCASDISGTAKAAALRLSAATEASLLAALFISSTRFNTSSVIGRRPRCRRCSS